MRKYIQQYLRVLYNSESISERNKFKYFSVDESLFGHRNNKQIWILGAINTQSKEFLIEPTYDRSLETIKTFIQCYILTGKYINNDGFPSYDFFDEAGSGFIINRNVHNEGHFGLGNQSYSYIEQLWSHLNEKLKNL